MDLVYPTSDVERKENRLTWFAVRGDAQAVGVVVDEGLCRVGEGLRGERQVGAAGRVEQVECCCHRLCPT